MVCLDSCIVIDYINGKIEIPNQKVSSCYINSIVENEVIVGARNKKDFRFLDIELV